MISISCDGISLSFGMDVILNNISFSLNENDKLGIVGVNGAGKSSLFKIITGEYTADSGNVFISKDKSVGVLDQNVHFESESTLLEEVMLTFRNLIDMESELEMLHSKIEFSESPDPVLVASYASLHDRFTRNGGYEFRGRCRGTLKSLGFGEEFWDQKVSSLSGGQKTRLALARILLREPDILMLDEPTNHLDMDALYWLEDFLAQYRKTVIVISHDRFFLDRIATKILEIENTHGRMYNGNYTRYVEQKMQDREIQMKHYKNQQKEIARIEAYIEQQRRWNRERNIIAAESRQKQLDKMVRVEKPENLPEKIRLSFSKSGESGNDVLYVRGLGKSFPNKVLFRDVDFLVKKNDHVFITGANGCGKSTLIKIIAGKMMPDTGICEYGYNVKVGYYDQENQQLHDDNTVIDEIWNDYARMNETDIRNTLALFLFKGDDIEKKVSNLSGGEKARLTLAKLILSKMNLLILDEPTNHLDINSREALEAALMAFDGTIIAVSHDRYFINKLSTRILDFHVSDHTIVDYKGSYAEYVEFKAKQQVTAEQETASEVITDNKEQYLLNKKAQSDKRKQERKLKLTQEEIEKIETELDAIKLESEGEAATDHVRLAELYERSQLLEERLLELYEILEELDVDI
ncbi:MAG: ATP-binding cassette domain-containing protein [Clostridia bacterium]|nr:ATP-binding cassette domain-containing protein [Clostridia bacterium]